MNVLGWILISPLIMVALVALWVVFIDIRDDILWRRKVHWLREREKLREQEKFYPKELPRMAVYKKNVGYKRPRNEP